VRRIDRVGALFALVASVVVSAAEVSAQSGSSSPASSSPSARAAALARVRARLGFEPRLSHEDARSFEGFRVHIGAVDDHQAVRVGCSDLALEPFPRCSAPDTGGAAILVATDDPRFEPFVVALSDELVVDMFGILPVAIDADPEPEFALVIREAALEERFDEEGDSYGREPVQVDTRLVIIDLDGTVFFDEVLVTCGDSSDEAFETSCDEYAFTLVDEDHDRVPELRVAGAVGFSAASTRMDRVAGDEQADAILYELEDSVRFFAFIPSARRFVQRSALVR